MYTKYGKKEGLLNWQDRQDKWIETLNSKSDEEKSRINKKKNSWGSLSKEERTQRSLLMKKRMNEVVYKAHIRTIRENLGHWRKREEIPDFELYRKLVWGFTRQQPLHVLSNHENRGVFSFHLDHCISILDGFKLKILPYIIGDISNLQFLPTKENLSKSSKSYSSLKFFKRNSLVSSSI